ncbi:MAG: methyltransferase domain-containing protein [Mesorhizobium sp.]|uniref:methyltransferase domain-containing protein n=1 Tax=Mesorhizobium sp. TaxID=1871066 RepID=UPI000FEA8B07|nr:methyltransferase domain-containing protein [Mesorhizobium sp.]RWF44291.1 MAG: methyltransferase domain-containing protein [Mesorhizobium sp.]
MWSIASEWEGLTAFVLAGGASVKNLDLSLLKGRRVIAINSAHLTYPDADILFFADQRWWTDVGRNEQAFKGRIVTTSNGGPRDVLRLEKIDPAKGIATKPTQVALSRTSVSGAINILVHLGCKRIVLLGVDGKVGADGQRHHHGGKYPWPMVKACFDHHAEEFRAIAPSLKAAGVEVINANPDSAIGVWPKVPFQEVISMLQRVPAKKPTLVVRGMYGIGDCIHQRAVVRELMRKNNVTLQTFYTAMYHDLVAEGLDLHIAERISPRIKDAGNQPDDEPWGRENIRISYDPRSTKVNGSLMASQFASARLKMPAQADFSLPVKPEWRAAAKALLAKHNPAGKPVMIYRPITLNKLWECPARSPDAEAYATLYQSIRDRFFVVSVCNLGDNGEYIVGPEQDADLKLHKAEAPFETLAGLFAEALLVFANPGMAPILSQAVGTPVVCVYGGHESYRTTNAVGAHLAPTLAIEPVKPCECFERHHKCDKRIDFEAALPKLIAFAEEHSEPKPRVLIFGTVFVDSEDKAKLVGQWQRLHKHLNPGCDLLLVDSASPYPWKAESGVIVHDFGDNIGHLARGGRDGWGRAFTYGLQAAIDGGYDYVVHIEGDSLCREPVKGPLAFLGEVPISIDAPAGEETKGELPVAMAPPVSGTKRKEFWWAETGLMFFDVGRLKASDFIAKYDWRNRQAKPEPERAIVDILGDRLAFRANRAERGDQGQITAANATEFDWITHCPQSAFDAFVKAAIPPARKAEAPTIKLNFGCGENRITGWCNYDEEVDITQPLPFEDDHADFIFAEHVVEHVDYRQALAFFAECRRVLKPGGIIRIAVPSLENIWKRGDQDYFNFVRKWAPSADRRGAMDAIINAHGHQAIWTQGLLEACLFYAGFEDIEACEPGNSSHADLVAVEGHGRVIGERFNWIETAVVEGTK